MFMHSDLSVFITTYTTSVTSETFSSLATSMARLSLYAAKPYLNGVRVPSYFGQSAKEDEHSVSLMLMFTFYQAVFCRMSSCNILQ